MKLICIEDVIMDTHEKAFSKGKRYKAYKSTFKDNYDEFQVIRAKNNQGVRHIIKYIDDDRLDDFFNKHFIKAD